MQVVGSADLNPLALKVSACHGGVVHRKKSKYKHFLIFIIYIIKWVFYCYWHVMNIFYWIVIVIKIPSGGNLHVFMGEQLSTVADKTQTPLPMNRKFFCAMFEALWLSTSTGTCACQLHHLYPR